MIPDHNGGAPVSLALQALLPIRWLRVYTATGRLQAPATNGNASSTPLDTPSSSVRGGLRSRGTSVSGLEGGLLISIGACVPGAVG